MDTLQKLEKEIELDVQELRYMMKSFTQESEAIPIELLIRNVRQIQEHATQLLQVLETIPNQEETTPLDHTEKYEKETTKEYYNKKEEEKEKTISTPKENETTENIALPEKPEKEDVTSDKNNRDFKQMLSLNDSFRFSRELFNGDNELMNRVFAQIAAMSSEQTATAFVSSKLNINEGNEVFDEFIELIKRYFNALK